MSVRSFDALVLGAGVIGLLVARELRRSGLKVAVLERDRPGRQASWASAGIIGRPPPWANDPYSLLRELSVSLFPVLAAELEEETGLDVEYRENGWVVPAFTDAVAEDLDAEATELIRAGVPAEVLRDSSLREVEPALGTGVLAGLLLPGGNVENRRLVRALELAEVRAGVHVASGTAAVEVCHRNGRVTGVRTATGDEILAPRVVVSAGSWSGQIVGISPRPPVVPQRGQILALSNVEVGIRRVIMTPGDPYLVPRVDGRLIVGATRELVGFDDRLTAEGVQWLLGSAIAIAPALARSAVLEMWTGFRPMSPDGLPIIGRGSVDGLYLATGHGPSGIGPAPGTAKAIAAIVLGRPSPTPVEAFSPQRFG